jgi:cyclase
MFFAAIAAAVSVSPGIWVLSHAQAPDGSPQGNTTLVVGEEAALVVDSAYLPSAARSDIAEIRRLTQKPVRYLLNTHWHPDHTRGNSVYAREFPGLTIIAQRETVRLIKSYDIANLARYPAVVARMKEAKNPEAAGMEQVLREQEGYVIKIPQLAFDSEVDLDLGGRRVEIRQIGRGHTLGDAIAWIPDAQVLATGDALVLPVPYFFNGYPADLARTLRELAQLGARTIVPGHGDVQHDNSTLDRESALIEAVRTQVNAEIEKRGSISTALDDARKAVDVRAFREQFAGADKGRGEEFDVAVANLIRLSFEQAPK